MRKSIPGLSESKPQAMLELSGVDDSLAKEYIDWYHRIPLCPNVRYPGAARFPGFFCGDFCCHHKWYVSCAHKNDIEEFVY